MFEVKMRLTIIRLLLIIVLFAGSGIAQKGLYDPYPGEAEKSRAADAGKMWTFDKVPVEQFQKLYGFTPDETWLTDVMNSALMFGSGCSGSFVSENGLIMTNHHCGRRGLVSASRDGEDLLKTGFYAERMEEERKIEGLYIDQLLLIKDVTNEVINAFNSGSSDPEKLLKSKEKISDLEKTFGEETGLRCVVVKLYNGGKYSLYGYRRYSDIRLVMAPEFQIASTGWDWDNFTYPRYEFDFMFLRAYDESGNPAKTPSYFKWSLEGAVEGEPVFVIGRPGNTDRLLSVAELEYLRDVIYPPLLQLYNGLYEVYYKLFLQYPEKQSHYLNSVMGFGNSRKSIGGSLMALRDEAIMSRKKDFESKLRSAVGNDPELKAEYSHLWTDLASLLDEGREYMRFIYAYRMMGGLESEYYSFARKIMEYANEIKKPSAERKEKFQDHNVEAARQELLDTRFDSELADLLLESHLNYISKVGGADDPILKKISKGDFSPGLVGRIKTGSAILSPDKLKVMLEGNPSDILISDDPFIYFLTESNKKLTEIQPRAKEISDSKEVLNQKLGQLVFNVFGESLSPDATSTLRISDGRVEGYEYNGTLAPAKTTLYGLYDRFWSFGSKDYPWGLPDRWKSIPPAVDLKTPVNFVSTADIVGGNSGSAIINMNREIVGLVFDGNLESLAGDYIYLPEVNRCVGVDSHGLIIVLQHYYNAERLVRELKGKNTED